MKRLTILLATGLLLTAIACKKEKNDCFDAQLYEKFKNTTCPQDGVCVIACDGKWYSNECMANQAGIRIIRYCEK